MRPGAGLTIRSKSLAVSRLIAARAARSIILQEPFDVVELVLRAPGMTWIV